MVTRAAEWGELSVLVNNAGRLVTRPFLEITEDDWDATLSLDLKTVFFAMQAAARRQRRRRSEEHTSELQSLTNLVCRLLLEKKKTLIYLPRGRWPVARTRPSTFLISDDRSCGRAPA